MFRSARLKLTAWYVLVTMLVSLFFSVIIFRALSWEIERFERMQRLRIETTLQDRERIADTDPMADTFRPRGRFRMPPASPELIQEAKKRIIFILAAVNTVILAGAGALGYVLAGRTLRPIQRMVDEQHRFVGDASHELRTPLTSLKSAFEVYLRDRSPTPAESRELVKESLIEVDRLQSLADALLQLAQFRDPFRERSAEAVPTGTLVRDAFRRVGPIAKDKKIRLVDDTGGHTIQGDSGELTNLLVILIDNAIKYSGVSTAVSVTSRLVRDHVELVVTDQGIGIAPEDQHRIFDRFFRADAARSSSSGRNGYGLGLSIAKEIAERHGGTIGVTSERGAGSSFIVRLPRYKGDVPQG
jgi:signal transduction histidine kinase